MDHDFFVLDTRVGCWYLSTAMAQAVDACLAAVPVPEWVTFVDLTGARVRVRTRGIDSLSQCSAQQRATRRAFDRLLREEQAEPFDEE